MSHDTFDEAILVVDDEKDLREIICENLSSLQVPIIQAQDGEEALELFKKHKIFLIISDFRMPKKDGIQLCRDVKTLKPLVYFIILSGFADKHLVTNSLRSGVSDVFEKPQDVSKLNAYASKYIEKRKAELLRDEQEMRNLRIVFSTEAKDLFDDIDKFILKLENEPLDPMIVDVLFRKAHTLKGAAGAFAGAEDIAKTVHKYESVLSLLRNQTINITPGLIDLLLRGADLIKKLIYDFIDNKVSTDDCSLIIKELQSVIDSKGNNLEIINAKKSPEILIKNKPSPNITLEIKDEDDAVLVSNEKLASFMELSGELIVFKNTTSIVFKKLLELEGTEDLRQTLEDFDHALSKISERLQRQIMDIRKVSLEKAFAKFPRMVRQISQELNKQIKFELIGASLGVDKSIAKALTSSLVHLIRNSLDHGIETPEQRRAANKSDVGSIQIECAQKGDYVIVSIKDDGSGINTEKVLKKAIAQNIIDLTNAKNLSNTEIFDLLFLPGFSTAEKLTSVSGRGVGLDVVKSEIAHLKGSITTESSLKLGTKFIITIPVPKTVMVENAVLARSGNSLLTIPLTSIDSILSSNDLMQTEIHGMATIQHKTKTIIVGFVEEYAKNNLEFKNVQFISYEKNAKATDLIIVLTHKGEYAGLRVNAIVEQQEAVIRAFDNIIKAIPCFRGTSILSNEKVAFVISAEEIIQLAHSHINP